MTYFLNTSGWHINKFKKPTLVISLFSFSLAFGSVFFMSWTRWRAAAQSFIIWNQIIYLKLIATVWCKSNRHKGRAFDYMLGGRSVQEIESDNCIFAFNDFRKRTGQQPVKLLFLRESRMEIQIWSATADSAKNHCSWQSTTVLLNNFTIKKD